ncbi:MAG: DNA adenine methylase [Candidatus Gracilibacteria bacterium]|jgi:DNA adenine methylase
MTSSTLLSKTGLNTTIDKVGFRESTKKPAKPFLKWVGGKTQLLGELKKYVPKTFNKYIEPFVGGGALLFDLAPQKAVINDANEELINAYIILRDYVDELIQELSKYPHNTEFYYRMRAEKPNNLSNVERAARMIYLNKTCFNGLYRVNKKGEFNVPVGRYTNPTICDEEKLKSAHVALQGVVIECNDFIKVLRKYAEKDDFIYIDPPYHPVGKNSDFKRYTKDFFYKEDQIALKSLIIELKKRGCFVVASNSYCDFILDLYKDFDIKIVNAKRYINKIASRRNDIKEIIIL